jgi:transposase InsO family protein
VALCRNLEVSKAGYYAWRDRKPSARIIEEDHLRSLVRKFHDLSWRRYGMPRIRKDLCDDGRFVGHNRVARLMREEGIAGKKRRSSRRATSSSPAYAAAPNLLNGDFHAEQLNQKWVADITYLSTGEGFLYLAVVLDLYSRRVVGWSMSRHINAALVIDALDSAIRSRKPLNGLIVHTDRGSQYACRDYRNYLNLRNVIPSMSEKAKCWQNAVAESFFATLKAETGHGTWKTRSQARSEVFEFIEAWYNSRRRHSTIGYLSPIQYEERQLVA